MGGRVGGWMSGWMKAWIDGCMDGWMDEWMEGGREGAMSDQAEYGWMGKLGSEPRKEVTTYLQIPSYPM